MAKVKIKLPYIKGVLEEPVFVGVHSTEPGGESGTWLIPRGKEFEVPEAVKAVLDNSEAEYQLIAEEEKKSAERQTKKKKALGLE